jgi:hypothetical protein
MLALLNTHTHTHKHTQVDDQEEEEEIGEEEEHNSDDDDVVVQGSYVFRKKAGTIMVNGFEAAIGEGGILTEVCVCVLVR